MLLALPLHATWRIAALPSSLVAIIRIVAVLVRVRCSCYATAGYPLVHKTQKRNT